jgi:hypothetical protein
VAHGFLRSGAGDEMLIFDIPGAGTGAGQGTFGSIVTNKGAITGSYVDANNVSYGYLLN